MNKEQKIADLKRDLAKSRSFSDECEADIKNLDPDLDYDQIQCLRYWISDAKSNQMWLEWEIDNVS